MPIFYSPIEVIEMAVKTEKTGQEFYISAAKKTKSKVLSQLFNYLAGEEIKHEKTYKKLYNIVKDDPRALPFNLDEMGLYLQAITDSKFFLGSDKALSYIAKVKTPNALLDYALQFEKETMLFYTEILNLVKKRYKPLVDKIIVQEKEHIRKLSAMKESI
ncbi:MAG: ferritin family protein [Candidatus Latescibacteria bacterium]|nr:ferritin family protein [Candidatus Latescibacterota bacterium]